MDTQKELDRLLAGGFISDTLEPIKCFKCGSTVFIDTPTATDSGHVSEKERRCECCNQQNGYWAFGAWQV